MDALASERAMTYSEPAIYPSRDYVTVHTSEWPTTRGQWYTAGQRFTIAFRALGQNEFLDANRIRLQFSVLCTVAPQTPFAPWPTVPDAGSEASYMTSPDEWGVPMSTYSDAAAMMPGTPNWGCPFFSAVRVQVPGLSIESFLTTPVESQYMVSTRLLCSSGTGAWDPLIGPLSYSISGEAELAGARSVVQRVSCVSCEGLLTDRCAAATDSSDTRPYQYYEHVFRCRGTVIHYSVPLSFFSHLFNQPSNLLPLSFYSTASDVCSLTFELDQINNVITNLNADVPFLAGPAAYYVIDPCISFTKLQVSNPAVLAEVEQLFRGVTSIPITPQLSIPVAMVMKFINYLQAVQRINAPTGYFNISIPANQPSCRGLAIRFAGEGPTNSGLRSCTNQATFQDALATVYTNVQSPDSLYDNGTVRYIMYGNPQTVTTPAAPQWNGKYLLTPMPRIRNLQLRIASFRVPLDPLSEGSIPPAGIPTGLTADPFALMRNGSYYASPLTQFAGFADSSEKSQALQTDLTYMNREAARFYRLGRHLFSPFASEEDPHDHAMAPFYTNPVRHATAGASALLFEGSHVASYPQAIQIQDTVALLGEAVNRDLRSRRTLCGSAAVRYYQETDIRDPYFDINNINYHPSFCYGQSRVPLSYWAGPGLLIIPFETLPAVYNHRDDAFANRGLDLRSINSIELSGEIVGVAHGEGAGDWGESFGLSYGNNLMPPAQSSGNNPQNVAGLWGTLDPAPDVPTPTHPYEFVTQDGLNVTSWTVRAYHAIDHMHVLLPGRVDAEAQFSLMPTGNTAIPSGGASAM